MSAKKEEERIEQLFKELDVDQKGYLDHISFLSQFEQTLKNKPLLLKLSKELVKECDQEGKVTAKEFREYCLCKQAETRNLFYKISKNNNFITTNDLKAAFDSSGIVYSTNDLDLFIKNITASKTGSIDIKEVLKINKWQEFFMFSPKKSNLKEALNFYTLMSNVDFNSDLSIPQKVKLPNTKINHLNDKEVVAGDIQKPAEIELKKLSNISQDGQWLKYLYAGGIAGAVSRTATAPLDRLKVLLQTETRTHRSYSQLVSIRKGIIKIYKDGGILSFFRGNGLNIVKIIPESALKFYVFEFSKNFLSKQFNQEKDELSLGLRFVSGGMAGLVSQFAIYPIETIKTRTMSQITTQKSSIQDHSFNIFRESTLLTSVKNLYKENGIKAFYRGVKPALIGIVPYAGVDLAVFETLKSTWYNLKPENDKTNMPTHIMLLCGMLSAQGTPSHPTYYNGAFDVIRKTFSKEGVVGFYRGLAPTLMKVLPAVGISYTVYEHAKRDFGLS